MALNSPEVISGFDNNWRFIRFFVLFCSRSASFFLVDKFVKNWATCGFSRLSGFCIRDRHVCRPRCVCSAKLTSILTKIWLYYGQEILTNCSKSKKYLHLAHLVVVEHKNRVFLDEWTHCVIFLDQHTPILRTQVCHFAFVFLVKFAKYLANFRFNSTHRKLSMFILKYFKSICLES